MAANQVPMSLPTGDIVLSAGKRARQEIMTVYFLNGGTDWLAQWAQQNPSEFFTKMFGKMIIKEVEHQVDESVETLLDRLDERRDARMIDVTPEVVSTPWDTVDTKTSSG